MKTLNKLMILTASSMMMFSCAKESTIEMPSSFEIEAVVPSTITKVWKSGEVVGAFSSMDENVRYIASNEGKIATFEGNRLNTQNDEMVYFISPYNTNSNRDSRNNYQISVPVEQVQEEYIASADNTSYYYMVGASQISSTKSNNPIEFSPLMSKMNFVVGNEGEDGLKVSRITMSSAKGEKIFATSATLIMNSSSPSEEGYQVNNDTPSLSVRVNNPAGIQSGKSEIISIAFFPVFLESGTELNFTIETNRGNYTITKTIGGISGLSFKKGEYYITPLQIS